MYANTSLVTDIGAVPDGGRDTTGPVSSSSAPGLMTRMLEMLDIGDGHRALEIGTGTGYNAALLCHRLGEGTAGTALGVRSPPPATAPARSPKAGPGRCGASSNNSTTCGPEPGNRAGTASAWR
ncbi:hypothetical protein [Saccharopolyspora shandongensis]|uniref:hypothetical protein n=1 Tax=Saccharopolyspora shandongensis TaxID=418495 RepID=UPI003F4D8ADE